MALNQIIKKVIHPSLPDTVTKYNIILIAIAVFTLINLWVSLYMSYLTIVIALSKCNCAIYNIYWFSIFLYFIFSGAYLVYTLLVLYGYDKGNFITLFTIMYIVSTIVFVTVSYYYTKYLTSNNCGCVSERYRNILNLISNIRLYMALITVSILIPWGLYVIYLKPFVNNR